MAGDVFYALLIFYFMVVSHVVFLVSAAGNDILLKVVIVLTWGDTGNKHSSNSVKWLDICGSYNNGDDNTSLWVDDALGRTTYF
jgi:hypothetical protein